MRRRLPAAILTLGLAFLLAGLVPAPAVSSQVVGPKEDEELARRFTRTAEMVPMRDGTNLHTLVYVPKETKGPLPFILLRTPYGCDSRGPRDLKGYLKDLADDGYIFVFQDIRG